MRAAAAAVIALALVPAARAEEAKLLGETRKVAAAIQPRLLDILLDEIQKGGAEGAIAVCRDKAPALARQASAETGWHIRRVSLRNRNPNAVPDEWEKGVLDDFDRRARAGENQNTLERGELGVEDGRRVYRYMKALPTLELCQACHGPVERLSPAVKAKLKELYPQDKAVGYLPGEIRGAITIKRPL